MNLLTAKLKSSKPVLQNIIWLLMDRALRMGVGVIVGIWVARYLGPSDFGILNYALAFVAIVGAIANLGLDDILLVDLIRKERSTKKLLITSFILRLLGAIAGIVLILVLGIITEGSGSLSSHIVFLTSLILIFQSFDVIDLYYQANLLSRKTVVAKNIAFLLASTLKVIFIVYDFSIYYFAYATLIEYSVGALLIFFSLNVNVKQVKASFYTADIAGSLLKRGLPLIFAALSILLYMRMDQIMIKFMLGSTSVGHYTAAIKLTEIWFFLPVVIVSSLMPSLVKSKSDAAAYNNMLLKLYSFLIYLSLAISVIVTLLSDYLILILYGEAYADASMVLKVHVWSCVFVFLSVASSQYLLIENQIKVSLYRTVAGAISNILLNFLLIPAMGITGAALATLASYFVSAVLSNSFFRSTQHINAMYFRSLNFVQFFKK